VRGRDGFIAYAQAVRAAFPDFHNQVQELVIDERRAAACLEYSGTHRGPIFAAAPTGRRVTYRGTAFFLFDEQARIARAWVLGDLVNLLKQLGATQLPTNG
jgi:predicted ester cyclase